MPVTSQIRPSASAAAVCALNRDDLIARYDRRAPRYTSYPTAVQFTPEVSAHAYRQWLAALRADDPVSLYLHIPFCSRLCWYCGCHTRAVNRREPIRDYVDCLVQEIAVVRGALPARLPANAIHFGGGTPNMLAGEEVDAIFAALGETFDIAPDAEFAVEIDPETLTQDWVRAAAAHRLTRASLGVQNLSPEVQAAVGRTEGFEQIRQAVGWLRAVDVGSINLDLMYGLPRQTVANTLATIDQILTLRPERLALFGYAHVPWMKANQRLIDAAALPGAAARLDQSEAAAERLIAAGYVRVGLDHFALPQDELAVALAEGRLHRNFQGYTTDAAKTLLGFGVSAIGSLPQGFVQNIAQDLAWRVAVAAGEPPIARGVAITADDRFRGEIIERLMCGFTVDLAAVCARHGRDRAELALEKAALEPFIADGLAILDGDQLTVTEPGQVVVRSVCALFDAHFEAAAGRHSKTL